MQPPPNALVLQLDLDNPTNIKTSYYFCGEDQADPPNFSPYGKLKDELTKLIVSVGETSTATSRLKLSVVVDGSVRGGSNAQVELFIWNATSLDRKDGTTTIPFEVYAVNKDPWNCFAPIEIKN